MGTFSGGKIRNWRPLQAVVVFIGLALFLTSALFEPATVDAAKGKHEVILRFAPGKGKTSTSRDIIRFLINGRLEQPLLGGAELWRTSMLPKDAIKKARNHEQLAYIEENAQIRALQSTPGDPRFNKQYSLDNTGQMSGKKDADIDAPEAWDIEVGSDQVLVAVIDSGVDWSHEDLADNIWTNLEEIPDNGIDDDLRGPATDFEFIDDVHGWDFVDDDGDPMDPFGHGTHVAGILGARGNNGIGISGVAWNVQMMPLRVLNKKGIGRVSDALLAIEYAEEMGARIVNMSWECKGPCRALGDAIEASESKGMLFVASAGDKKKNLDKKPIYPAAFDLDNLVTVGATNQKDVPDPKSNFGASSVDLSAPGKNIHSTLPKNRYGNKSGTSMAAAHVSGTAALLWSQNPDLTPLDIRTKLLGGVDPIKKLKGKTRSGGRLNAFAALGAVTLNITAPAEGSSLPAGATVTFSGRAESGAGDASAFIEWASDRDGKLGTGASVSPRLSEGGHTITASVSANGFSASASISITADAQQVVRPDLPLPWDGSGTAASDATDADRDGLPDGYEREIGLNPNGDDADSDADGDGFSNIDEYIAASNPLSASSKPGDPGTVKWRFPIRHARKPVVGADGTIYLVGVVDGVDKDGQPADQEALYALHPNGQVKWSYIDRVVSGPFPILGTARIGPDGNVYIWGKRITNGAVEDTGLGIPLAFGTDGTLYTTRKFGAEGFRAVDPSNGKTKWEYATNVNQIVQGQDGTVYVITREGSKSKFVVIGQDGNVIRSIGLGEFGNSSSLVASDATIYLEEFSINRFITPIRFSHSVTAYKPDGERKWSARLYRSEGHGAGTDGQVILPGGAVHVGADGGRFLVQPDGTSERVMPGRLVASDTESGISVGDDGTFFKVNQFLQLGEPNVRRYTLTAWNPATRKTWFYPRVLQHVSGAVMGVDGTVFVASRVSGLYAFATASRGPAASHWPMEGHDPSRSFNAATCIGIGNPCDHPPALFELEDRRVMEGKPLNTIVAASNLDGPIPTLSATLNQIPGATFTDLGNGTGRLLWKARMGDAARSPLIVPVKATDPSSGETVERNLRIVVVPEKTFPFRQSDDGLVVVEAEHFESQFSGGGHQWSSNAANGASGNAAVVAGPNNGTVNESLVSESPRLNYRILSESEDRHSLWIRGRGSDGDDSLFVSLDGRLAGVSFGGASEWTWVQVPHSFQPLLGAERHLSLWMREDGVEVDKILLSTNLDFVPSGAGPDESPRGSLRLSISSPAPDETIHGEFAIVQGTVVGAAPNTGVVVNNRLAAIIRHDEKTLTATYVARVPLLPGDNRETNIRVVATSLEGEVAEKEVTVKRLGDPAFRVIAVPARGLKPLDVEFQLQALRRADFKGVKVDFTSNGKIDKVINKLDQPIAFTYERSAIAKLTVTYDHNIEEVHRVPINALSDIGLASIIHEVWSSMAARLAQQDIEGGLTFFTPRVRGRYRELLTNISEDLPDLFGDTPRIGLVGLEDGVAEYLWVVPRDGTDFGHFIYFTQSVDGLWRLESF